MKKLVSIVALMAIATPSFAASKAERPSYLIRTMNGGQDVTYSYADKVKSGWYGSVRAELNFLSWKNKYSTDGIPFDPTQDHDNYSFESVFAGNIAFGKRLDYFWRAEVEGGYITKFTDKDEGIEFSLSIPYLMANGYYDFENGFYLGAGVGLAFPTTTLDAPGFSDSGNRKEVGVSPMLGLMAGLSHELDDNLVLDLRYRLAGMHGTTQGREVAYVNHFENKIGLILDNSISIGIRYEF